MSKDRACRVCRQRECACEGIGNCSRCGRKFTNRSQFKRAIDRSMICKDGTPCATASRVVRKVAGA